MKGAFRAAIVLPLMLAACTRWNDPPATSYEKGDLGIKVQEIQTGPGEYDLRAHLTNVVTFQSDPLQLTGPLEDAAKERAAALCSPQRPTVTTVAQQPPIADVFIHVRCNHSSD